MAITATTAWTRGLFAGLVPSPQSSIHLRDLITFGSVHRNGLRLKDPYHPLTVGDTIQLYLPRDGVQRFYEITPSRILYRDRWILAYDKEPGIPSHQLPHDDYNNTFEALRRFLATEVPQPYVAIHHRLDQEASGVLLFATHPKANRGISTAFSSRRIRKFYLLSAEGTPPGQHWCCREPITKERGRYRLGITETEGKPAETFFTVLYRRDSRSFILAQPKTGRTHQIRLHLTASGLRLYGDRLYGGPPAPRLMLHSWRIILTHPVIGSPLLIEAPPPPVFADVVPYLPKADEEEP